MSEAHAEDQHEGEGEQQVRGDKLITAEHIEPIWNSEDPLADMFEVYTSYFNPSHDPEYSLVDDNEIKFLAEFQIYNLIFCKNDMRLNDSQTAEVLDVFWNLLAVNEDGSVRDSSMIVEGHFKDALHNKLEEVKFELIERAKQGVFSKDEIKALMGYMKSGYFKHFRLVDFVLRNRQMPTFKHITLFHDDPLNQGSLDAAKEIVEEPMIPKHEGEGDAEGEGDEIDINKDPLDGLDQRLNNAKLDDAEKNDVKAKLQDYRNEAGSKLDGQKKEPAKKK